MALILSNIISQASGSVGGLTFTNNASGMVLRSKTMPTNPNTAAQQVVRNAMKTLAGIWNEDLDDEEVDSWIAYAAQVLVPNALGVPRKISAYSHFIACNSARLQAGLSVVETAPVDTWLPTFTLPTFVVDASDDTIAVTFTPADDWANETGGAMLIYASAGLNPGRIRNYGSFKFAGRILGNAATPPASPATIALPTLVGESLRVHWRVRVTRADGRLSSPFQGSVLVQP